ncbi:MAG: porin family protein [Proteobacteria bacterium]|nr:porin family protein [Pseudomonadota bacterium]
MIWIAPVMADPDMRIVVLSVSEADSYREMEKYFATELKLSLDDFDVMQTESISNDFATLSEEQQYEIARQARDEHSAEAVLWLGIDNGSIHSLNLFVATSNGVLARNVTFESVTATAELALTTRALLEQAFVFGSEQTRANGQSKGSTPPENSATTISDSVVLSDEWKRIPELVQATEKQPENEQNKKEPPEITANEDKGNKGGFSTGPTTFYINLGGGTGIGYESKDASYNSIDDQQVDPPSNTTWAYPDFIDSRILIEEIQNPNGSAWAGVPVRLAIGYFIVPKLSLEISGRFDVYIIQVERLQSCWDLAQDSPDLNINDLDCSINEREEEVAKKAVIWGVDGLPMESSKYQYAWLVNVRARYQFFSIGSIVFSAFGGVGYGHIQYRVPVKDESKAYFPMPGMVDIEVGPAFSYFFNDYIGLNIEFPIDIIVGDGFALNFDLSLGLGFGF